MESRNSWTRAGDLRLLSTLRPCACSDSSRDVISLPQEVGEFPEVRRIVGIWIPVPLQVADPAALPVEAAPLSLQLEGLPHVVRREQGGAARAAVDESRDHGLAQGRLRGHINDGVVNDDGGEFPAQ